jgi:hypothetical protein
MELMEQSVWYNADVEEIVAAGEAHCESQVGIGATLANVTRRGIIAVIEDDLGDVVYSNPNCLGLFTKAGTPREATTDYLPEHERGFHRRLHRRAVKSMVPDEYELTARDERWTVEFYPFREQGEVFTLTLFSNRRA